MMNAIAHRGPDGEGYWLNGSSTAGLGHRRLAIIDLSQNGSQPMHYPPPLLNNDLTTHLSITYNGEIYNYPEIKEYLKSKGYQFISTSDTEVILASYDYWKEACVERFDGMFAFAIWDHKENKLFCARDRFGEKPFYYFEDKIQFIFGSEMKALWAAGVVKHTDEKMLLNYITLGYVQNVSDKQQTFFENICSLPPAHYLTISLSSFTSHIHNYWVLDKESMITISPEMAIQKYNELFRKSVSRRLRSDVPVGTSLSGGLDSSAIVATISQLQQRYKKLHSFSAVFPGFAKDESIQIKAVVKKFQLQNFQIAPTADGFIKDFHTLCYHQEEPFTSASMYAQYKVFELAKKNNIKVLLDGQGADETHAGYHKYIHWYLQQLINRKKFKTVQRERHIFKENNIPVKWNTQNYLAAYFPAHAAIQLEKNEYFKVVNQPDINPEFIHSLRGREWEGIHKPIITKLNDILYFNTQTMGLEELLRFADRNSMAHGREVRLPFLSHKLVQYIFSLPANYKIHEGWTKWILRNSMNKILPGSIVWRTDKVGFEPPQADWLNNKTIKEYIYEAKRKLVYNRILKSSALNKNVVPKNAYDVDNFDFRYLCAAQII